MYAVNGDPTGGGTALIHLWRISRGHSGLKGNAFALLWLPILLGMFVLDKADRVFSMWFMATLSLRRASRYCCHLNFLISAFH